jgi:hypothetical protein
VDVPVIGAGGTTSSASTRRRSNAITSSRSRTGSSRADAVISMLARSRARSSTAWAIAA